MIKVNVLSEENSWSKKIKKKELFFNKICNNNSLNCKIIETEGNIVYELKKKILKTAANYKEENKKKE